MSNNAERESVFTRAYQVGVVVRDLQKAIQFYESLGIGPFVEGPSADAVERKVYGKPSDMKLRGSITQMGQIEFELLQPVSGDSLHKEFLEKKGEGVIHICFYVDDLDNEVAKLAKKGFKVVHSAVFSDGGKCAYIDTCEVGGIFLELFQLGTKWK
jgi:catechol 2,3-dioxygenase-like lactoylglutathione lyase family enzyme